MFIYIPLSADALMVMKFFVHSCLCLCFEVLMVSTAVLPGCFHGDRRGVSQAEIVSYHRRSSMGINNYSHCKLMTEAAVSEEKSCPIYPSVRCTVIACKFGLQFGLFDAKRSGNTQLCLCSQCKVTPDMTLDSKWDGKLLA